jgi:hypothetical protein
LGGVEGELAPLLAGALLDRVQPESSDNTVATVATVIDAIRAVGPAHCLLSSEFGQPCNPPVEDGLALMADRLFAEGFTDDEIHTMAVVTRAAL